MKFHVLVDSFPEKKEMNEIEKQLHEQYAVNANNNLVAMIAIATVLLTVIGAYGYIYLHASSIFVTEVQYTTAAVMTTASAALIVLGFLFYISLYLGTSQRKEQFIIYAIRRKYYGNNYNKDKLFPKNYHPFDKRYLTFVQGLHNISLWIYAIVFVIILISAILAWVTLSNDKVCSCCGACNCICFRPSVLYLVLLLTCAVVVTMWSWRSVCRKYKDYQSIKTEYKEYESKLF